MTEITRHILGVATARLLSALFLRTSQATRVSQSTTITRSRSNNHYVIAMETFNAPKSLWMIYFLLKILLLRQLNEVSSQPFCSHMQLRLVETLLKCQTR